MRQVVLAAVAILAFILSCGRAESPLSPVAPETPPAVLTPAPGTVAEIQSLLADLFPSPVLSSAALFYFGGIEDAVNTGRLSRARRNANLLIAAALRAHQLGILNDPPGPTTTEEALAHLIELLLEFVGLTPPDIPPDALTPEGAFAPCGPRGCQVLTGTEFAGVNVPKGALDQDVFIVIRRLDDFNPPLDTYLDQYPLFYSFSTIPETALHRDVLVGLCVVDPPDPFAPSPTVAARLRLAHDHNGVQILPLANALFLDCTGAETESQEIGDLPRWLRPVARLVFPAGDYLRPVAERLLNPRPALANPGKLGAAASSFSPFAAVDPESGCQEQCETF